MKVSDVIARMGHIVAMAPDYEAQHAAEDAMHQEVLRHFAANAPAPWRDLAAAALMSTKIEFPRECA